MNTLTLFRDYLGSLDAEKAVTLGDSRHAEPSDAEIASRTDRLVERMRERAIGNDRIAIVMVALYILLFAGSAVLVFTLSQRPAVLASVLGGDFLSLGTIVFQLRSMWREKNMLDMLICILPEVKPSEAVKVIQAVYFKQISAGAMSQHMPGTKGTSSGRRKATTE